MFALVASYVVAPTVPPEVGSAVTDGFGTMTSFLVTTLIPALFGILVIGIGVRIGVKWLKRGASS
jgi:hypothetical protein